MHRARLLRSVFLLVLALFPRIAMAHPMGNFSVNHYTKITLEANGVRIDYKIDLAEIPTFQELQQGGIQAIASDPNVVRYVASKAAATAHQLTLSLNGKALALHLLNSQVLFPAGAGGLPTMKMAFTYQARYPVDVDRSAGHLTYADHTYEGHSGWKEIVAGATAGQLLSSSVPAEDRSHGLTDYPTDLLNDPPQALEARIEAVLPLAIATQRIEPSKPVAVAKPAKATAQAMQAPLTPHVEAVPAPVVLAENQQKTPRSRFTELVTAEHLSAWFLFTAALIAMALGGLHALEPGHGKTVVAAYLVGSRGTPRHAILLGLIVTASHTIGVFALGAVTLYASRYIVPERLYPWLGMLSGLTIVVLGGYMLLQRLTGTNVEHSHLDGESHGLWPWRKRDEASTRRLESGPAPRSAVGTGQLLALGVTGGIIPCPAALIVLLSAFALHRIALGFFLIVAFSVGLAAVLIAFGMLMVYARRYLRRLQMDGPLTRRWLPVASSIFITGLGIALTVQAASSLHLGLPSFTRAGLGTPLFVVLLGLVLGMRHSTDADHVVAISTIVSRRGGVRQAAVIGSLWGLGHTITIFVVGSLIILFHLEIPPRLGLFMEFSVALMLIALGLMNLSGTTAKITRRFSPTLTSATTDSSGRMNAKLGRFQTIRPLFIGLVHGLAGSAAVALLVLSTISNPLWATLYLLIFGAGTMLGMMGMTTVIAVPLTLGNARFQKMGGYLATASGLASLCFGSFLAYQLGIVGGLFTSHPHWTPQ